MLILASASKARSDLLKQVRIKHQVMVSDVDEDEFFCAEVKELVQSLSAAKAKCIASKIVSKLKIQSFNTKNIAVLGCDSLFEFNGEFFGKPPNQQAAIDRLIRMSSNSGVLHTGHCLIKIKHIEGKSKNKNSLVVSQKVVSTKINFSKLTNLEIQEYVKTNEPLKCAGGFAIDGRGAVIIDSIEGCYSNVIGLSLPWLRTALMHQS